MTAPRSMEVLSISQLNRRVKQLLESQFSPVWLEGEISNFTHHTSGHMYFALKDNAAQIPAVMFASANRSLPFVPRDGLKVMARGDLTIYEARGQYQIIVRNLYPAGAGDLMAAFEELRAKLLAEGLFDSRRKRPLPLYPRTVGVLTSSTGAALQDIISVIGRRAPHVRLLVRPTLVQGAQAVDDIVAGLEQLAGYPDLDTLIVSRGGGSLEDLWAFNDEKVVRAVAGCPIPVVCAIGHETDTLLCELAADVRAPTPSAAAELAVPERAGLLQFIDERLENIADSFRRRTNQQRQSVEQLLQRWAFRRPQTLLQEQQTQFLRLIDMLAHRTQRIVLRGSERLSNLQGRLQGLDPAAVMQRGYALVEDQQSGKVITGLDQLHENQDIVMRFTSGRAGARVTRLDRT